MPVISCQIATRWCLSARLKLPCCSESGVYSCEGGLGLRNGVSLPGEVVHLARTEITIVEILEQFTLLSLAWVSTIICRAISVKSTLQVNTIKFKFA